MITIERLKEINASLPTIKVKGGKEYVMVHSRIMAFREMFPEGAITTDIIHMDEDKVVMKCTVTDENGQVIGTGIASEKFNSSTITSTSAFEVCETSAIGRALGCVGIGIDASFASADEVANAITQQANDVPITDTEADAFMKYCERIGEDFKEIGKLVGAKSLKTMTKKQHADALRILIDKENNRA